MRIAIIGTGHMGSWLGRELCLDNEVVIYDIIPQKTKSLANSSVRVLANLSELQDVSPEMLINAVSLQNTITAFEEVIKYLNKSCIICDIASIKGTLPDFYQKYLSKFVSIHPMFGPTYANMDSLKEENVIIIKESCREGSEFFRGFFSRLGLRIFEYSFHEHDKIMAYSLSLPFISTLVFASCVDTTVVPGTTFSRHLKIAKDLLSEDDHLLGEILFNPHSLEKIDKITGRLEYLKHIIRGKDFEEIKKFFERLRDNLSAKGGSDAQTVAR
ncbi:MAG: prephenate dehydrogenase/arogenate dehydrogenase family protein, partial [Planctomycetota bacterium]|nr:prephenate dehydrogenase/arogenate dehydrogenase family protein [Planctomycetota bacterium]